MFSNRRGSQDAWEQGPWQPRPYSADSQDNWHEPSWENKPWRGKQKRHPPSPWQPWPFPGPADFYRMEEDRRLAPEDSPHPPPSSDYREEHQRQEENFTEDSYPVVPLFALDSSNVSELSDNKQLSAKVSWEQGVFQESFPPCRPRGLSRRCCRYIRRVQQEMLVYHSLTPSQLPTGMQASSKSAQSCPQQSQPGGKEGAQSLAAPQPASAGVQSKKQAAEGLPGASREVLEPSRPAASSQKSPAPDPRAVEQEPAAGAKLVKPVDRKKAAGSQRPGPSALKTKPVLPENACTRTEKDVEQHPKRFVRVEPCSQSVPKAAAGAGSPPHSTSAPQEPAETAGAAASPGVEVSPGAAAEPNSQPSQASSNVGSKPAASPRTGHPPGGGREPAAGCQPSLCSTLPAPTPASTDLRSAAVLARKKEIELSYQQFSLTIAMVATMLLQKEPSMEAALGLALRANLRQVRTHHLQELEDFINSYDSGTPNP